MSKNLVEILDGYKVVSHCIFQPVCPKSSDNRDNNHLQNIWIT